MSAEMGTFARAKELRQKAGLTISGLSTKLGTEGPRERTIRRIEQGGRARIDSLYRLGNVINASLKSAGVTQVDLDSEIQRESAT